MSNIQRKRWDLAANGSGLLEYSVLAADAIEIGDLLWFDKRTQTVKSFAHADAWTGSTDGAQGKVAENFVGVAQSAHAANDSQNLTVRVHGRGTFEFLVGTAITFEVGDLVNAVKNPSFNLLYAQYVDRGAVISAINTEHTTRAREIAIGKVAKRTTAASGVVVVEIQGTRVAGGGPRQYLTS